MNRKTVSGIMLTLLLESMFLLTLPVSGIISGIELKYRTQTSLPQGWIYVLVETSVFNGIEISLEQYTTNLESIDGFSVGIYTVSPSTTPTAIRSFLQQALLEGLVGCLLIGDVPKAYYEWFDYEFGTYYKFPTDFYYMDLDGIWSDTDSDGAYDTHSGETSAEIWIGTLQPSLISGNNIQLLNNYFKKNRLYRTGKLTLPKRALVYLDVFAPWGQSFVDSIKIAYDETVLVNDDEMTIASDYRERLLEGYEWIYLATHGSPGSHTFELHGHLIGGTVYGFQYRSIDPHTFFYVLHACYTSAGYNNVAGSAVFTNTYGLLAIGNQGSADTTLETHHYREEFYEALSEGKCIGEAYLEDIKIYEDMLIVDPEYEIPGEEYGWQIVGDPSLHIKGYPIVMTINDLKSKIEELGSEGDIDNKGIVTSLIAKLNVAQKLVEDGKIDQAKNILNAFINEVQAQSGKHITPEAAELLIESAEYILSHL